jgi:hypothetical protein
LNEALSESEQTKSEKKNFLVEYRLVLLVWSALFCADFVTRLLMTSDELSAVSTEESVNAAYEVPRLTKVVYDGYLAKLNDFVNDEVEAEALSTAGVIEESSQSEVLQGQEDRDLLRTSNFQIRLLGIFGGAKQFAVVDRYHFDSGLDETIAIRLGDDIDGYVLTEIFPTGVRFIDATTKTLDLRLFVPSE